MVILLVTSYSEIQLLTIILPLVTILLTQGCLQIQGHCMYRHLILKIKQVELSIPNTEKESKKIVEISFFLRVFCQKSILLVLGCPENWGWGCEGGVSKGDWEVASESEEPGTYPKSWIPRLRNWKWSHVRLFATPWTIAYQAPPSMGFSRQGYWSGLPLPSPGDLPNTRIKPGFPTL